MAKKKSPKGKKWCVAYRASHTRERNKVRTLRHHLKRFPDDKIAIKAMEVAKIEERVI